MSRKLQSQIQSIKKMPGKHKRVLLAFAARANNDGTNIYAAKETIADDAGVSRWTVYRNLDDLVDVGVIIEATSHVCNNPDCHKGSTHLCRNGRWTQAYDIAVAMLQNATQLVDLLRSKMPKPQRSKMPTSHVAKCDATQSLDSALLVRDPDSSALTSGLLVSSLVSSDDSLRSSSTLIKKSLASLEQQSLNPDSSKPEPDEPPKVQTRTWLAITTQEEIPLLLGIPDFHDDHDAALTRIAKVLVQRNRSAEWLKDMIRWMKEHKKFWAQRLHTGDRAVEQLAKHMESGSCCEQFDSNLVLKLGSEVFSPSRDNAYLLPDYAAQAAKAAAAIPVAKFEQEPDKGYGHAYHTPADIGRGVPSACRPGCGHMEDESLGFQDRELECCGCGNPTSPGCGCGFEYEPADDDDPPVYCGCGSRIKPGTTACPGCMKSGRKSEPWEQDEPQVRRFDVEEA